MRDVSWLGYIRCIPWSPLATFNLNPLPTPPPTTFDYPWLHTLCSTFEITSHCSTTLGLLPLSEDSLDGEATGLTRVVDVILCNMSRTSPVLCS